MVARNTKIIVGQFAYSHGFKLDHKTLSMSSWQWNIYDANDSAERLPITFLNFFFILIFIKKSNNVIACIYVNSELYGVSSIEIPNLPSNGPEQNTIAELTRYPPPGQS